MGIAVGSSCKWTDVPSFFLSFPYSVRWNDHLMAVAETRKKRCRRWIHGYGRTIGEPDENAIRFLDY